MLENNRIQLFPKIELNKSFWILILKHFHTNLILSVIICLLTCVFYNIGIICFSQLTTVLFLIDLLFKISILVNYFYRKNSSAISTLSPEKSKSRLQRLNYLSYTLSGEWSAQQHFFQSDDRPLIKNDAPILSIKLRISNALQFIKLQIKYKEQEFMSISLQSDDQTIDESNISNIQVLIKENKIKDLALNKATSLIELLSIELQVQRNNKQQAVRQVQQSLRLQFSRELQGMKQKIEFLERQLKRSNAIANNATNVKTKRHSSLSRSDSSYSLQNKQGKRKQTVNKKYTQINSQEGNEDEKKIKIQVTYLEDHFLSIQAWKQSIIDQLNEIANNDYQQLQEILARLQSKYIELEDVFSQPQSSLGLQFYDQLKRQNDELHQILKAQKLIINQLKLYIQDLQDIFKHFAFKISNLTKLIDGNIKHIDVQDVLIDMKLKISHEKKQWIKKIDNLQEENKELKNILDNIIRLLQNQRRIIF